MGHFHKSFEMMNSNDTAFLLVVGSSCDVDWSPYQGSCYYRGLEKLSWPDARAACQNLSSYLVIIETPDKNAFLAGETMLDEEAVYL